MTRARFKIFFGAAPGVGKTYAMLEEARRAREAGEDVVIGIVETHGRGDTTKLVEGIPVVPPRGRDLDVAALLARKPARVLFDELAHTNATGSKHAKRWQDVVELLDAGIEVHTTLNVQHIASLGDVVQQINGASGKVPEIGETVPDAVIDFAELELVDVPLDELLKRTTQERGKLLALRELALRRTAARVDADVVAYRKQHGIATAWPTSERILVCVGPSPGSERLIRATKRIAEGLHASWTAAHVEQLGAPPLDRRDRERVENHLRLAESLGANIERLAGPSVARALLEHARTTNVTRIVAGKPTHARWRDRLRGSLLDDLIRGSGTIEVHVIAPIEEPAVRTIPARSSGGKIVYAYAIGAVVAATALGLAVFPYMTLADITMLYLIAIMLASLGGRGPSLVAASLAVGAFDFCFAPPRWTFAVSDARHILTFAVMFGAGLAISTLVVRMRRQERDAVIRERNTAALLAFTRDIASATTPADVAAVTVRHIEASFPVGASVLDASLVSLAGLMPLAQQEQAVARWTFDHREPAGLGTDTLANARVLALPLGELGVLVVQAREDPRRLGGVARPLLETFARQAGLALARVTEERRSSLLSTVSHDLRTPLAVITGAATALRDGGERISPTDRAELLSSIVDDAQRLERVLANILQLTRVEAGLVPARELIPVEELVGAALTRMEDRLGDRAVSLAVPSDLQVSVDPVLFEQALINLLENAVKHGQPPIELRARRDHGSIQIDVRDHGAGIPPDNKHLFDKFVRASTAPGAGLGLAVVRAIVEAHGGKIDATNAADGGARFAMELPA